MSVNYPNYSLGFFWLFKIRCGYKFDTNVAVAAGFVNDETPRYFPCCRGGTQTFTHWILVCPFLNNIRTNRLGKTMKILEFFKRISLCFQS